MEMLYLLNGVLHISMRLMRLMRLMKIRFLEQRSWPTTRLMSCKVVLTFECETYNVNKNGKNMASFKCQVLIL